MKVIHSNTKSLQPIPTETGIRSNVFSNTNNTNQILPTNGNISVGQNNSPVVQNTSAKNGNAFPFFALWCVIILVLILVIFVYKKYKKK